MTRRPPVWPLVLMCGFIFCVYLLGNGSVGLLDRDEPRYAQTSRQMLLSGDWVVPHFLDKVRTAKPVFIYWCQAGAMRIFGDNAFAARFPSSLAMLLTLLILAVVIARETDRQRGIWTAFILGTSGLAIASAKMCMTDSVLLLWITVSQLCIYRLWRYGPRWGTVLVLGLSIGIAGLTKGPVALGVNATTLAMLWLLGLRREKVRSLTWTETIIVTLVAAAVIAVVVLPWLVLIHQRAPGFLHTAWSHDVVDRAQRGQEGHSAPPGFYSVLVWGTFFPWSLLLPAAVVWGWKRRGEPAIRFALAAFIGPWVMFELIATKLPHYVLPTYPVLAFLVADVLLRSADALGGGAAAALAEEFRRRGFLLATRGFAMVFAAAGLVPAAALVVAKQHNVPSVIGAIIIAIIAIATALVIACGFRLARPLSAASAMGGGMLLCVGSLWTLVVPHYQPIRISQNVADEIIAAGGRGEAGMMIDYKEPSLAFAQGGGLREQPQNDYFQHARPADWPKWLVVTRQIWDKTPQEIQLRFELLKIVRGFAYSDGGGEREVLVLRNKS